MTSEGLRSGETEGDGRSAFEASSPSPLSVGLEGCKRETVEVVLSCGKMGKVSTVEGGLLFNVVKTNGWERRRRRWRRQDQRRQRQRERLKFLRLFSGVGQCEVNNRLIEPKGSTFGELALAALPRRPALRVQAVDSGGLTD